jgi:hypothetical protein
MLYKLHVILISDLPPIAKMRDQMYFENRRMHWQTYKNIELTDPQLGSELSRDPKGDLPIAVWDQYFWRHSQQWRPVLDWSVDRSDPRVAPINPQRAVDEALPLAGEVITHIKSRSSTEALVAIRRAVRILKQGCSDYQPKRGQTPSMQHIAVRAYIIRKFNPHPDKPGESTVSWARLADMLFLKNGNCPRKIRDEHGTITCGLARHQYDSPCVKALTAEVTRLKAAMKHDGIPV